MLALNTTDTLTEVVRESFRQDQDGYFYPVEPGTPLVRVYVASDSYTIERRRNAASPWMPIVTADVAEFDPTAFRIWRSQWTVVA
jgi:hypothetical protein